MTLKIIGTENCPLRLFVTLFNCKKEEHTGCLKYHVYLRIMAPNVIEMLMKTYCSRIVWTYNNI